MPKRVHAVVLAGHGSLRNDSGEAMFQVAAQLRKQGVASVVEAGFLNYSSPTLAEAIAKCVAQGANDIIIQPYFLIAGVYVMNDLPGVVKAIIAQHRGVHFHIAEALGEHPALVKLAHKRVQTVDPVPDPTAGLLFVAHGTPLEKANTPISRILARVQARAGYAQTAIGYLDCNEPDIPTAIAQLVNTGVQRIVALPYFLHLGRHVCADLPKIFEQAQQNYPQAEIRVAAELGYDPLLTEVAAERIMATMMC
ncbi:hypothetical protein BH10CHL1_BH10CHL1_48460 [soil metagenome]